MRLISRLHIILVFFAVFVPLLASAQESGQLAGEVITVQAARIHDHGSHTRVVFDMTGALEISHFTLAAEAGRPDRVVIDLAEVTWAVPEGASFEGTGVVQQVRHARNRPGHSRIVLDLLGPATVSNVRVFEPAVNEPAKIVMDLIPVDQASFEAASGFPEPDAPAPEEDTSIFTNIDELLASLDPKTSETGTYGPVVGPVPNDGPMLQPGTQIAEEDVSATTRTRPVIVIDPGHGGRDPGATTTSGVQEKSIALDIGRAMRDALEASDLFDVAMTRNEDVFLQLNDRYAVAQDLAADLFISIHVDSNDSAHARGVTVYTLSENASDAEAAQVAARENQSDRVAGYEVDEELTRILIDLAQRETMNLSAELANVLVDALASADVRTVNRPHRFAGFRVLTAPDVPSILLETGFASNADDAALLVSDQYQQDLSQAMTEALVRHFDLGPPGELWLAQNTDPGN